MHTLTRHEGLGGREVFGPGKRLVRNGGRGVEGLGQIDKKIKEKFKFKVYFIKNALNP